MLVHFSHLQWLSRVEAFGPVLHFWWNPLEHTLHLTGTVLERKAAEHLAHFSFEFFVSAGDKPWFKRDFNDGKLDEEANCQVIMKDPKLLMLMSGDDSVKLWWKERVLLRFLWGLQIHYTWLQGDKHYRKMGSHSGKLISTAGAETILANGARFSNSRGTIWLFINWSRWYNNFGDSSAMLRTFPGDRATRIFW